MSDTNRALLETTPVQALARLLPIVLLLAACKPAPDAEAPKVEPAAKAQAVAHTTYPTRAYFGDTHVHTGWSVDAGTEGVITTPEEAFRLARGDEVTSNTGRPVKLKRPLDWMAITDHSDGMGTISEVIARNPEMMADPVVRGWSDALRSGDEHRMHDAAMDLIRHQANGKTPDVMEDPKWMGSAWQKTIVIADKYNAPGKFTAFIGYEWTVNANGGNNLHRNIIYRDGADKAKQMLPLTTFQSQDPETLWAWMEAYERTTGGKVLAIPHNGNLSNGRMFEEQRFDGRPLTREYAQTRARWEPFVRSRADQGAERKPPAPVAQRCVCELGSLGCRQSRRPAQAAGHAPHRILARGAEVGLAPGTRTRCESLQARRERRDRHAHGPAHRRGRQLLGQVPRRRTVGHALATDGARLRPRGQARLGHGVGRLHGRVGDGEHARSLVGCDAASRNLRDHRHAHDAALLRRFQLQRGGSGGPRRERLRQGRADGRRPVGVPAARQGADLPHRGDEGRRRREPRPRLDHQGLGRRRRARRTRRCGT